MRKPTGTLAAMLALGVTLSGCASAPESGDEAALAGEPTDDQDRSVDIVGDVALEPRSGPADTDVRVVATGLPPGEGFALLWTTVDCDWVLAGEQSEEYQGRDCTPREAPLGDAVADQEGRLAVTFRVPEDYGFAHDVLLVDGEGVVRAQALFSVEMEVSVTPEEGPVGTPITIEVSGMGWQSLEDTRTILYDHDYVGFLSAVTTRGAATAVIPATGQPGPHRIEINRGAYTFPYLNPQQSPRPDIPTFEAEFSVTDGDPVLPAPIEEQNPAAVLRDPGGRSEGGPALVADVLSGPVGTPLNVDGSGFPADSSVEFQWYRIVGNRVSGQGWDERAIALGEAPADGDGAVRFDTELPGDVGGPHRIEAIVDGEVMAETTVSITPHADAIPTRVRWGDRFEIHLSGVGWTETANIYTVVYDNAYIGYACGFNTQGDVVLPITATGQPGWHFIELYPAIYKGEEKRGRDNFRIPQLTAADDHPGEDLPIFRLAFYIEG